MWVAGWHCMYAGAGQGTVVMNMIGSPKHVDGCIKAGVDIVCAQGTEAGAHTGSISTLVLLPQVCTTFPQVSCVYYM